MSSGRSRGSGRGRIILWRGPDSTVGAIGAVGGLSRCSSPRSRLPFRHEISPWIFLKARLVESLLGRSVASFAVPAACCTAPTATTPTSSS